MFRSRLKIVLFGIAVLALALPTLPVLADCTVVQNPYGGRDWDCTGNTVGVINGTPMSDRITNHGTVTGYIWSAGFSSSTNQQDTITNHSVVGDGQPNPETNDDDDGIWGSAGNDTIVNNGTVIGGRGGAILGDGSGAYSPDQDYIVHNGIAYGDVSGDFQARGHDTIIINGAVEGGVYGDVNPIHMGYGPPGGGNDLVIIRDNASISGIIDGNLGSDTLRFELTPQDQAEYDALVAALAAASPASGSLTFRSRTFNWQNFETLTYQLNWMSTGTPTATPTNTPTPTNAAPGAVVVNITVPPTDGSYVATVADTRFQAVAYDSSIGTTNGAGITRVEFEIYTPGNVRVYTSSDSTPAYCTFGGNGPCNMSNLTGSPQSGVYRLRARAQTSGGTWTEWVTRTFLIGTPPAATATHTPTNTPTNTATATATSTNTLTATATDTPTNTPTNTLDAPTNTPTATATDTPTNTPTNTLDAPTNTPTATSTDTPTETPTDTPDAPTNTPTATSTDTPTGTPTDTPTATATDTPTNTPTNTPTATDTPTNTATNTPTSTPTDTPTATNVPAAPVVNFIVPATDGSFVGGVQDTRFQAVAYNPAVGTTDGAGITRVEFEIYTPNNIRAYTSSDTSAPYCVFGGNPCNVTPLQGTPQNGTYTLRARALISGGTWTNWVTRTFVMGTPPAQAINAPASTSVPPTATEMPTNIPEEVPQDIPTELPGETSPATDVPTTPPEENSNEQQQTAPEDNTSSEPTPEGTPSS